MAIRTASAEWNGDLKSGGGRMALGSGAWEGPYSFSSRFEEGNGTNPEELIGAAHAGCFSMALSKLLSDAGHPPESVKTRARVHLETGSGGPAIPKIELSTEAVVPGMSEEDFQTHAETAKKACPVSKVLAGAHITLQAALK